MFSSNGYVSSKWGFDRGWDVNRNFIRESLPNGADYLWKTAKAWIDADHRQARSSSTSRPSSRTSCTRRARSSWSSTGTSRTRARSSRSLTGVQLGSSRPASSRSTTTTRRTSRRCTTPRSPRATPRSATFIADLKALGLYDKSAIIVVSDHGDQFYEHGSVGHGDTVYQELVHVPLDHPRARACSPPGRVVQADVEVMDVYADAARPGAAASPRPQRAGDARLVAAGARRGGPQPARRADRRRSGGARPQGAALPPGPPRPRPHRALRRARRSARAEGRRGRPPDRAAPMRGVLGLLYAYETTWSKSAGAPPPTSTKRSTRTAGPPGRRGAEPKSGGPK